MDLITTKEVSQSDETAQCVSCNETFLVKYWDDELDWYIEINLSGYCRQCQPEEANGALISTTDAAETT